MILSLSHVSTTVPQWGCALQGFSLIGTCTSTVISSNTLYLTPSTNYTYCLVLIQHGILAWNPT